MRKFLQMLAVALSLWPVHVGAQDVHSPEAGIKATIGAQIDAFKSDDFARAFTYASPNIQGMFGSSENFGRMVRNGYPMVWRPGDVQFLELHEEGGRIWQKVMIRDRQGKLFVLDYQMIETADGWRINGVQILEARGLSA